MTRALAAAARRIEVSDTKGLRPSTVRRVLASIAQLAQENGSLRWGLSIRKIAALADMSASAVERAQRWLRCNGFLEVVEQGGGRGANLYRVIVDKLFPAAPPAVEPEPEPDPGEGGSDPGGTGVRHSPDGGQEHDTGSQGFSSPDPRAAGAPSPPASIPPSGRCGHGRTSCRRCGTSPRGRARGALVAAEQTGRACRMCVGAGPARGGGTYWVRAVPGTQTAISPDQPCDHRTPTQHDAGTSPTAMNRFAAREQISAILSTSTTRRRPSRASWRQPRTTERTPA